MEHEDTKAESEERARGGRWHITHTTATPLSLSPACHLPPQLRQLRQQGKHAAGIMHGEKLIGLRGHLKSTRCNSIHNYNPFGPVYAINS